MNFAGVLEIETIEVLNNFIFILQNSKGKIANIIKKTSTSNKIFMHSLNNTLQ